MRQSKRCASTNRGHHIKVLLLDKWNSVVFLLLELALTQSFLRRQASGLNDAACDLAIDGLEHVRYHPAR